MGDNTTSDNADFILQCVTNGKNTSNRDRAILNDIERKLNKPKNKKQNIRIGKNNSNKQELSLRNLINVPLSKPSIRSNNKNYVNLICQELNRLSELLIDVAEGVDYIEDPEWTVNMSRQLNFVVPDNHVVFSNTLTQFRTDEIYKRRIKKIYMWLSSYVNTDVKMYELEDNKYDITWLLFVVEL